MHKSHCNRAAEWVAFNGVSLKCKSSVETKNRKYKVALKFSKPHSRWTIPSALAATVQTILSNGHFPGRLCPESNVLSSGCNCGAGWIDADELLCKGSLYTPKGVKQCEVMARWCKARACRVHFDGSSCGIFNFSGKTLVSYDVLLDYAQCAMASGMTFAGFCAKKSREYSIVYGGADLFLTRVTFSKVYQAYAHLRDRSTLPPCSICGQFPLVLQADATDLAMPAKYLQPTYRPVLSRTAQQSPNEVVRFAHRVLVECRETRKLLTQFVTGEPQKMTTRDWNKMIKDLQLNNSSIVRLLEHLQSMQPCQHLTHYHFAGVWHDILKVLGSNNSITDLVRPGSHELVRRMVEELGYRLTPNELQLLELCAPLLKQSLSR